MLIEFSVENCLSFKDRQTLSMVAGSDKEMPENTIENAQGSGLNLLKSAAVYGANASGKSNLIKAFAFMQEMIVPDFGRNASTQIAAFAFDESCWAEPVVVEAVLLIDGIRYVYGFKADPEAIREEWLSHFPKGQYSLLFHRRHGKPNKYGSRWKGERKRLEKLTTDDSLFLYVARAFNHEIGLKVRRWFSNSANLVFDATLDISDLRPVFQKVHSDTDYKERLLQLLTTADLGIIDIETSEAPLEGMSDSMRQLFNMASSGESPIAWQLKHKAINSRGETISAELGIEDESDGTKRLLVLAAPIFSAIGGSSSVLITDELDLRLHPLLTEKLIRLFNNNALNKGGSQLVFTTHDSNLLDKKLFRRDQIWFTEKKPNGSTDLYSLWDFKKTPRKDENLRKGYLAGRYGAIPFVGDFNL